MLKSSWKLFGHFQVHDFRFSSCFSDTFLKKILKKLTKMCESPYPVNSFFFTMRIYFKYFQCFPCFENLSTPANPVTEPFDLRTGSVIKNNLKRNFQKKKKLNEVINSCNMQHAWRFKVFKIQGFEGASRPFSFHIVCKIEFSTKLSL